MATKRGLGRGLDALFLDNDIQTKKEEIVNVSQIEPNKDQPRKHFDNENLTELAESIKEYGLIQPILVRPLTSGNYQIVAGERRWRASRMAGITEVPVIVKELNDSDVMKIALVENLQRQDLNPIEEALGYKSLMEEFSLTQDEVSKSVGKARTVITNSLRLLNLPDETLQLIAVGDISKGHGKVLLSIIDKDYIVEFSRLIVEKQLSVRQLEQIIKNHSRSDTKNEKDKRIKPFYIEAEISLKENLGTDVRIKKSKNKHTLEIDFFSDDDLNNILANFKF